MTNEDSSAILIPALWADSKRQTQGNLGTTANSVKGGISGALRSQSKKFFGGTEAKRCILDSFDVKERQAAESWGKEITKENLLESRQIMPGFFLWQLGGNIMKIKISQEFKIALIMLLFLAPQVISAKESKEEAATSVASKEITGEVSGVSNNSIAVVYKKDLAKGEEYEVLLLVDGTVQLERIKNITQLKIGDTVTVAYDESFQTNQEGTEITDRKVKTIKFMKPAPPEPSDSAIVSEP